MCNDEMRTKTHDPGKRDPTGVYKGRNKGEERNGHEKGKRTVRGSAANHVLTPCVNDAESAKSNFALSERVEQGGPEACTEGW
jgi:hypothetical protein